MSVKVKAFKVILISLICGALWAQADPVTFEGLEASHQKMLAEKLPSFNSSNASLEEVDQVLRTLMLTGEFERVVADRADGTIRIIGTPLRLVGQVEIEGNRVASEKQLNEIIKIMEVKYFNIRYCTKNRLNRQS